MVQIKDNAAVPRSIAPLRSSARGSRWIRRGLQFGTGLLLASSIAACTVVGPDYQAPETKLEPLQNAASVEARQTTTPAPALDQWWAGFNDPVLTRIVERTLAQNLDLEASVARVRQARAAAEEAGSRLYPQGSLEASISPIHQSTEGPLGSIARHLPGYDRDQSDYNVGVGASWEIDLFGGLQRGVEAADAEAEAAEAEHAGVRVSVVAEAADAYFQIRGAQARLKVAADQIATDQHLLDLINQRRSSGAATDRETAQAEALLEQAQTTIPPLKTTLEAEHNRLDVLMGVQPGTDGLDLSADAGIDAVPAIDPGKDASDLLRRRPDIIAAERKLAASNAQIGEAISEYYPKVSLSGLLGFESLSAGSLFTGGAFQPQMTAGLHWRLFDFGKVDAEVAQAKGGNAEALAKYRKTVLQATEDVEDAFTSLVQLEAQNQELGRETASLTTARDKSEDAYRGGAITLTDVLDADRQLLAAEDDLARTKADAARAAVTSYRALGGGW
ncbi:RND transporter [Aliidongia dinghuensis]|uniref:RND transporter n=1 Tax=Aliidongia dinghuensis TaxID=1867774 RepID=A0A8J3E1R5_9PROT|nr:efflux transporter outer membrane subunit [Aliidongia dinghuensis]GGF04485.1 RND transporter [Aliidongia dinghuensis]